ncbi:Zn-dependent exopeptidase [Durotheca rogersii]|uniref:Zn-dependent exopeptidase n=1 Tax=Durotheca rogersii TaxID=419775 RepID=UPI00221E7375|nr:Zn-dependent exopeptidase [Durotheca rogersii]KAI5859606.1 Zn-dependent exopeptidase [Durotheca rogersii]
MKFSPFLLVLLRSSRALGSELQKHLEADAPPYRDDLVSLHKSLVDIASISGEENEVGNFLVDYLTARNFVVQLEFVPPLAGEPNGTSKPRFNVLAWPGPDRHPSPKVLVTSHIDVVPPYIPYSRSGAPDDPLTRDTVFAGRGSVDAKASVAAQITALRALVDGGAVAPSDAMLLYVVGEERSGDGMRYFSETRGSLSPPPDFGAAIFGEPTEGQLACGHKGIFACDITARGRAGHSGYPWLGRSAIEVLVRALVKVLDADLGSSDDFGNTTVNVGVIEGGVALNVIPERAVARIAARVAIGPELGGGAIAASRLQEILRGVDPDAFDADCNTGYGVVACDCEVEGFETTIVNYGTDVPNLKGNHTRYLYGPGSILVAHGADEAITLGELEDAVEGYKKLILHAIGS